MNTITHITSKLSALLLSVFVLTACDSFFSTEPDNRLQIDNLEKVQGLLTNAYPEGSWLFVEWMTDNVGLTLDTHLLPHMVQIYTYSDISEKSQDTPTYYWTTAYRAVAHANQAIDALNTLEGVDQEHAAVLRSEALLCRAYAHFMLVNLFAKPYNAATAESDLGVPYVKRVENKLLVHYTRQSVAEVYREIEADLLEGLSLKVGRSERYYPALKYHFSHQAALAFASRYYLFKGDYAKCIEMSDKLLGKGYPTSFIKDYGKVLLGDATRNAKSYTNYDDPSNIMLQRVEVYAHPFYRVGYRTTNEIFSEIFPKQNDVRSKNFFIGNSQRTVVYAAKYDWAVKDEAFPYMIVPTFRGEEVFFNRLEALLFTNNEAEVEAQLDHFIQARYNEGFAWSYTKHYEEYVRILGNRPRHEILLRMLLDERRREFYDEGLRWLDIRRYNLLPITHEDVTGSVHSLTPEKLTLQIPDDAISNGITSNPR